MASGDGQGQRMLEIYLRVKHPPRLAQRRTLAQSSTQACLLADELHS